MRLPVLLPRCLPSLVGGLVYVSFILVWHVSHFAYDVMLNNTAFMADAAPYGDLNAILQASACAHQGVNVYAPSHCMHGGMYNYSPFFLHLSASLGPAERLPLGLAFGAIFLLAACLLPPAEDALALALRAAALCSGTMVWGLETANLDCLLFALCAAGLALVLAGRTRGYAGYVLFTLAGALKFYPAILLALALREPRRRFTIIAGVLALGGVVFLWRYGGQVLTALAMLPAGLPFRGVFGAFNWGFGLALLRFLPVLTLEPNVPQYFAALNQPFVMHYVVITGRLLTIIGLYTGYRLAPSYAAPLAALPEAEKLFLAGGALLIVFCFYLAQNLDYRGMFLLLTLPGLQLLARAGSGRYMPLLVTLLLWEGAIRHFIGLPGQPTIYLSIVGWLLREYGWWFLVVRFTAITLAYQWAVLRRFLSGTGMLLQREAAEG